MNIEEYIQDRYDNNTYWFEDEVNQSEHIVRVSEVCNNKEYLNGNHKILTKEDFVYKGKEFITRKLVLQISKTIMNFHSTYLLGKKLSLTGSENKVKEYENIYRKSHYNNIDFKILDKANKYGDSYEYVYLDDKKNIASKIIASEDGYPVYSEDDGTYLCFIEHYTKVSNSVSYYNVYYEDRVEQWNNEGGELHLVDSKTNISGLPIHYHNQNDYNDFYGISLLSDIIPIIDELEFLFSKMGDGIYTLSLNPLPILIGQEFESGTVSADATGYVLNIDSGSDFKYANAMMDYSTIKLYLDKLQQQLNEIAHMPSIAMGNTNISNVSEVSLKLLFQLTDVMAMLNEQWIREGLQKRFDIFDKLLKLNGITFNEDEYIDVDFNYARPINGQELLANIKTQFDMGAISIRSVIEKSPLTGDVNQEIERLDKEKKDKAKDNIDNNINGNNTDMNNNIGQSVIDNQNNVSGTQSVGK